MTQGHCKSMCWCATLHGKPWANALIDWADVRQDDVIKWKHFPRYWPFVWEIHRPLVNSLHKGQWRGAVDVFFDLRLNKRLSKQSWSWWSGTPSRSLWRQCNEYRQHEHCFCFENVNRTFCQSSNMRGTNLKKKKMLLSSRLAVVFAQPNEARG